MTPDYRRPEWRQARNEAEYATRLEFNGSRIVVSLLLPVAAYFYSPWAAAALAVPCALACGWYVRRSIRQFMKREAGTDVRHRRL